MILAMRANELGVANAVNFVHDHAGHVIGDEGPGHIGDEAIV